MLPPSTDETAPPLAALVHDLVDLYPVLATGLWSADVDTLVRWRLPVAYIAALVVGALVSDLRGSALAPDTGAAMASLILGSAVSLRLSPPVWTAIVTVAGLGALQGAAQTDALPHFRMLAAAGLAISLGVVTGLLRQGALLRGLSALCALAGLAVFVQATRA